MKDFDLYCLLTLLAPAVSLAQTGCLGSLPPPGESCFKSSYSRTNVLIGYFGLVSSTSCSLDVSIASTFDEDDVADIAEACDADDMPEDRYLVLSPAYIAALRQSGAIKDASGYGYAAIQDGLIPMLHGFKVIKSNIIPANGENLVGFATDGSGIASAFRYLMPQDGHKYDVAEPVVGDGGITLGCRKWYSEDQGNARMVLESVYGYETGIATGIQRIVSS